MSHRVRLLCHPAATAPAAVQSLQAELTHADDGLHVRFTLRGDVAALSIPAAGSAAGFTDGLWQHSCCELFVAAPGAAAYREFNLAPSGAWAAYAFSDYRQRDMQWQPSAAPTIQVEQTAEVLVLEARIPTTLLPTAPSLQIGITTVIEAADATLSYWALAHAGERPDFHLRASFAMTLAPQPD